MRKEFFKNNDIKMNGLIAGILKYLLISIPLMIFFDLVGLFTISVDQIFYIAVIGSVATLSPSILIGHNVNEQLVKYYIMVAISIMICMLGTNPSLGIYITLALGIMLSLLYLDPHLTQFACFLNYFFMIITQVFRMYNQYYEAEGMQKFLHASFAYCAGFTIEFLIVCPLCMWISRITRNHLQTELELLESLESEQLRYKMIMESTHETLYEYDAESDVLSYYGPLTLADRAAGKSLSDETRIERYLSVIQAGELCHPDDVDKMIAYTEGDCSKPIQIRMIKGGEIQWLEIDGRGVYVDNVLKSVVGKIIDITDRKLDEQRVLKSSEKDSLTGFYERRIGVRMIRENATEAGRTDIQTFLFMSIDNAELIRERMGSVYLDAVVIRLADIVRTELSDMDLAIRFTESTFLIYLANRTPTMFEKMQERIQRAVEGIYVGKDLGDESIRVRYDTFATLAQFEKAFLESDVVIEDRDANNLVYHNEMVSFTFNLLDQFSDFEGALGLVMDHLISEMNLDCVRIFETTSKPGFLKCIYERMSGVDNGYVQESLLDASVEKSIGIRGFDSFTYESISFGDDPLYVVFKGSYLALENPDTCKKLSDIGRVVCIYMALKNVRFANRAKTEFLSSISHEVRTPMSAIAGFAELIMQEGASDVIDKYANSIRLSADGLVNMVDDILDFSRIETGKLEIMPVQYRLHTYVGEVCDAVNYRLADKNIRLITRFDDNMPDGLIGDGARVKQILSILLNNAVTFTDSGEIGVELFWEKERFDYGVLNGVVWDTGNGLTDEQIDNFFEAYGSDVPDTEIKNIGISVALVKSLLELMNGTIRVESVQGRGTKLVFTLPQGVFDGEVYNYDDGSQKQLASGIPFSAPWSRILVVDDNMVNIQVAKGLLLKYRAQVVTAKSGEEAIEILKNDQDFDLVFMDHMMPEMSGIEATQAIRGTGNPILIRMPIVALTANVEKGAQEELISAGMNDYLAKPINLRELADIMTKYIPPEKRENGK